MVAVVVGTNEVGNLSENWKKTNHEYIYIYAFIWYSRTIRINIYGQRKAPHSKLTNGYVA